MYDSGNHQLNLAPFALRHFHWLSWVPAVEGPLVSVVAQFISGGDARCRFSIVFQTEL